MIDQLLRPKIAFWAGLGVLIFAWFWEVFSFPTSIVPRRRSSSHPPLNSFGYSRAAQSFSLGLRKQSDPA